MSEERFVPPEYLQIHDMWTCVRRTLINSVIDYTINYMGLKNLPDFESKWKDIPDEKMDEWHDSFIIESCSTEFDTQSNESFHRTKLKYATKDVKWGKSWNARMMCAVLDRNVPYWKLQLYDELGLPKLSTLCRSYLQLQEESRLQRKLEIHSDEYRKKKMKERKEARRPVPRNRREILLYEYEIQPQHE